MSFSSILRSSLFWGRLLNLLDELIKFAFYSIKIRLQTADMKILSVALLSRGKKSECGIDEIKDIVEGEKDMEMKKKKSI